ncbi:MAG: hypothetical protein E7497_04445 [Ruminococcus sp.]|nr:hypothetical protein [Ruminococcus sp.]
MPASFLCNLTKNPTLHLSHKLCEVLPYIYIITEICGAFKRIGSGRRFFYMIFPFRHGIIQT